jgi:hypothetical protein
VLTVALVTFVTTRAKAVDTCVPADRDAVDTDAELTFVLTSASRVETCVAANTDAVDTVALDTRFTAVTLSAEKAVARTEAVETCVAAYTDAVLTLALLTFASVAKLVAFTSEKVLVDSVSCTRITFDTAMSSRSGTPSVR